MKYFRKLIIVLMLVHSIDFLNAQTITLTAPPNGNNQKSSVTQWIGLVSVNITYRGPDVMSPTGIDRRGHIWGELVPYGLNDPFYGTSIASPWRAGANEITTVTVSHDVTINGKPLKAGTYGLFLLVEKDKPWTWIFSSNSLSWGSYYYDAAQDVLRVESTPEECAFTEWLTYGFDDRQAGHAVAYLQWETKRISFKVGVPNPNQLYVDKMREELTSYAGFNSANWLKSAQFCLINKINMEEAIKWVDLSMNTERFNGQKTFGALKTKADLLYSLKRDSEADQVMTEALSMNPTMMELHSYGRGLLAEGKNEKALTIFKINRERNKQDTFTTLVGLARGYTAVGSKKEAIRNWELALKNIPEDQKANLSKFEEELSKLKQ